MGETTTVCPFGCPACLQWRAKCEHLERALAEALDRWWEHALTDDEQEAYDRLRKLLPEVAS